MTKCQKALKLLFEMFRKFGWTSNGLMLAHHSRFGAGAFAAGSTKYVEVTCTDSDTYLVAGWRDRNDPAYAGPERWYPIQVLYRGSIDASRDAIYKMVSHFVDQHPLTHVDPQATDTGGGTTALARRRRDRLRDAAAMLDRYQFGNWTFSFQSDTGMLWMLPPFNCGIAGVLLDGNTHELSVVLTDSGKDQLWNDAAQGGDRADRTARYREMLDWMERPYAIPQVKELDHFVSVEKDANTVLGAMIAFAIAHPAGNLCPEGMLVLLNETRGRR